MGEARRRCGAIGRLYVPKQEEAEAALTGSSRPGLYYYRAAGALGAGAGLLISFCGVVPFGLADGEVAVPVVVAGVVAVGRVSVMAVFGLRLAV